MTTSIIQIEIDDELKEAAVQIFDRIGLDLSLAVRMFLERTVLENGLPFSSTVPNQEYKAIEAFQAMERLSKEAMANGASNLTLEEINTEIRAVRQEQV